MPEISTALIIKIIVIVVAIGGGIAVIYSVKKAVSNAIGRQLSRANDLLRTTITIIFIISAVDISGI